MNHINHRSLFFCPRWGQQDTWDTFLKRVKDSGYEGIEASLPGDKIEKDKMLNGLNKYDLLFIGQHWQTVNPDFKSHCSEFENHLSDLASVNPLFINSQTGKDYFSMDQNKKLISIAENISITSGIKIIHETHRGKFSFAAHVTKKYLEEIPQLRLTLDISHWCTTAESLLGDQLEAADLAVSRTDHIHARIGFQQGSQVPDPRDPEWSESFIFHLDCWDQVAEIKKKNDLPLTITPEFGPFPYMINLPYSGKPIADQWEINEFMMNFLRKKYQVFNG